MEDQRCKSRTRSVEKNKNKKSFTFLRVLSLGLSATSVGFVQDTYQTFRLFGYSPWDNLKVFNTRGGEEAGNLTQSICNRLESFYEESKQQAAQGEIR